MAASADEPGAALLALYDRALPVVYGYLLPRCGAAALAEDLTAETFLAAVDAVRGGGSPALSTPWLVGIARHKLADHWRRAAREERGLRAVAGDRPETFDPWDERLDTMRAQHTLQRLAPQYRAALTLRYVDDLPVAEVADVIDRTLPGRPHRARTQPLRRTHGEHDPDRADDLCDTHGSRPCSPAGGRPLPGRGGRPTRDRLVRRRARRRAAR